MTTTLTWIPATGKTTVTDPPSEPVYIAETGFASEQSQWNGMGSAPGGGSVSDGFGDMPVSTGTSMQAKGIHLIQRDGSSGTIVLPAVTLSAISPTCAFTNHGGPEWINSWVSAGLTVAADMRGVTISASFDGPNDSTPTFSKIPTGGVNANGDPLYTRVAHKREPDGTMRGDMGLDYGDGNYIDETAANHVNVTFTANPTGNWAQNLSQYLWNTSLKNASYTGTLSGVPASPGIQTLTNSYNKPFFPNLVQSPSIVYLADAGSASGVPQVDHLFFKYQNGDNRPSPWTPYETGNDGDGAVATANYYLSLHQTVEFLPSKLATGYITKEIPDADVEVGSPGYASPGFGVNCTWNAPGAYWDYLGGGVGAMAEIPGVDEIPWLGLFCATAGIAIDHLKPVPDTGPASFDPVQPGSTFPDETLHPFATTPHTFFEMFPHILGNYQRTHLLQDTYNTTGFVGEKLIDSDAYQRVGGNFGDYKYHPGK